MIKVFKRIYKKYTLTKDERRKADIIFLILPIVIIIRLIWCGYLLSFGIVDKLRSADR